MMEKDFESIKSLEHVFTTLKILFSAAFIQMKSLLGEEGTQ